MKIFLVSILVTLLSFGLFVSEASAKRFGGGRSFGVQRSYSSLFSQKSTAKNFTQPNNPRKWGGVLGGLLAGGLLASLFMGHGLGAGLMSWLVIGGLAFFIMSLLRKKMPNAAPSGVSSLFGQANQAQPSQFFNEQGASSSYASQPQGFETDAFLREAKVTFLRLQTAYDQKNRQDLCDFTAPEVFAEIEMQLNERGNEPNKTEVMDLKAEMLDVSKQVDSTMVSVRFTGFVKENDDPMSPLDEIWHFRQFAGTKNWVVGGIQQEVVAPN